MTFVLDTSVLIDVESNRPDVLSRLQELRREDTSSPVITFVTHMEFLYGLLEKSSRKVEPSLVWLNQFKSLDTTRGTSIVMASLRRKCKNKGLVLSFSDCLIAALVIENKMVLVTRDRDFEKVDGLRQVQV